MQKSSEKKHYTAIGCMSGTAMDGIDIALIKTDGYGFVERLGFVSAPYADELRARLKACLNKTDRTDDAVHRAETDLTLAHGLLIKKLISDVNLSIHDIDIIGFHGQTIHHDPARRMTVQLGNGDLLARETGIDVACDFRSDDVAAGGQGAPLLPIYHRALAMQAGLDFPVAIINIGGVGNITWISRDEMIAFDTGPGNALIDDAMTAHFSMAYDEGGKMAAKGVMNQEAVNRFLSSDYFLRKYPKSLDRNDFAMIMASLRKRGSLGDDRTDPRLGGEDMIATLTEMTVQSIALGVSQCPVAPRCIYVTGGGRHNDYIMKRLNESCGGAPVRSVDDLGWNGDAMEAEGFAYMAVRTLLNEPISFPNTTGVPQPMAGGKIVKSSGKVNAA